MSYSANAMTAQASPSQPVTPELDGGLARQAQLGYWAARRHMLYYQAVFQYAAVAGHSARNVLDVGCAGTDYVNWFYWIPDRYVLDYRIANPPPGTTAIETDFLSYRAGIALRSRSLLPGAGARRGSGGVLPEVSRTSPAT